MTSLDANTGYLYLNFACSEFGALASFSTVAIMQQVSTSSVAIVRESVLSLMIIFISQMITAMAKP